RLGQIDVKAAAASVFTLHDDISTALLDDAVHGGEPEARTLAFFFGGEKRLKDARLGFFVHAHAGVAEREHDVAAGTDELLSASMALIHDRVLGLDSEPAAVGHCV